MSFTYRYDRNGNRLGEFVRGVETSRIELFTYDSAQRLIGWSENSSGAIHIFRLDGVGNWIQLDSSNNAISSVNEYTEFQGEQLQYDDNGNLVGDSVFAYAYDFRNRLVEVRRLEGNRVVVRYSYDAMGRRSGKWTDGAAGVMMYFWDGPRMVEDRNGSVRHSYTYGMWIDEVLRVQTDEGVDGSIEKSV